MEQSDHNLLIRWFFGLSMDAPVGDAMVHSKNCDRLVARLTAPARTGAFFAGRVEDVADRSERLSSLRWLAETAVTPTHDLAPCSKRPPVLAFWQLKVAQQSDRT